MFKIKKLNKIDPKTDQNIASCPVFYKVVLIKRWVWEINERVKMN